MVLLNCCAASKSSKVEWVLCVLRAQSCDKPYIQAQQLKAGSPARSLLQVAAAVTGSPGMPGGGTRDS